MSERTTTYIIDEQQHRESVATRHLMEVMPLNERLLEPLGLSRFSWTILELRLERLLPDLAGEIDILAGPLTWTDAKAYARELASQQGQWPDAHPTIPEFMAAKTLADNRGIAWPPPLEYLIGVEIKCAYNEQGTIKADKSSPEKMKSIRKQLTRDLNLGLNRVAFVDIIAHHPTTGIDGAAWLAAGVLAHESITTMGPALAARLADPLPDGSFLPKANLLPVAHFVWSIGSVAGGDETIRGAGAPILLRPASPNPRTSDRTVFERSIHTILSAIPQPTCWPVILKDCRTCNTIHHADGTCPEKYS